MRIASPRHVSSLLSTALTHRQKSKLPWLPHVGRRHGDFNPRRQLGLSHRRAFRAVREPGRNVLEMPRQFCEWPAHRRLPDDAHDQERVRALAQPLPCWPTTDNEFSMASLEGLIELVTGSFPRYWLLDALALAKKPGRADDCSCPNHRGLEELDDFAIRAGSGKRHFWCLGT